MMGTNASIMNETLSICATIKVKSAESDLKPNTFTFKNIKSRCESHNHITQNSTNNVSCEQNHGMIIILCLQQHCSLCG